MTKGKPPTHRLLPPWPRVCTSWATENWVQVDVATGKQQKIRKHGIYPAKSKLVDLSWFIHSHGGFIMTMVYNDGGFIVLGVSINVGTPIAGWLNKNGTSQTNMDDLGVPLWLRKAPYSWEIGAVLVTMNENTHSKKKSSYPLVIWHSHGKWAIFKR